MAFHRSIFEITVLILVALSTTFNFVNGQGRMLKPAARASVWRVPEYEGRNLNKKFDDDTHGCGGKLQFDEPGSDCGVCGDPLSEKPPRSNEIGGRYFTGLLTGDYQEGQEIDVAVEVTSERRGYMQWRLCPDPKRENQECFNENVLPLVATERGLLDTLLKTGGGAVETILKPGIGADSILKPGLGVVESVLKPGLGIVEKVLNTGGGVINTGVGVVDKVLNTGVGVVDKVASVGTGVLDKVLNVGKGVFDKVLNVGGGVVDKVLVDGNKLYKLGLRLPKRVSCEHCVIQWNFRAIQKRCENKTIAGRAVPDCEGHEVFRGCSDVRIAPAPKKKCCKKTGNSHFSFAQNSVPPAVIGFSKADGTHFGSISGAQYYQARKMCLKQFSDRGGHLAMIETEEEFMELQELFQHNNDLGEPYWLEGIWDPEVEQFRWISTKELVGDWIDKHWADGQPGFTSPQTVLQVVWEGPVVGLKFTTGMASDTNRFICEYTRPSECGMPPGKPPKKPMEGEKDKEPAKEEKPVKEEKPDKEKEPIKPEKPAPDYGYDLDKNWPEEPIEDKDNEDYIYGEYGPDNYGNEEYSNDYEASVEGDDPDYQLEYQTVSGKGKGRKMGGGKTRIGNMTGRAAGKKPGKQNKNGPRPKHENQTRNSNQVANLLQGSNSMEPKKGAPKKATKDRKPMRQTREG